MIEEITIKNYILLKDVRIELSNGLNIITGETGTGKSILINAIGLLIGERADYSVIKKNCEKMIIETYIKLDDQNINKIQNVLKRNEIENETKTVIIRRELNNKNIGRIFINDTPASVSILKEIGNILVDIHSQNEHQSLLKKENHIDILDSFKTDFKKKNKEELLGEYDKEYKEMSFLINEIEELKNKKKLIEEKREFIDFQLKEINEVKPQPKEDEYIEKELNLIDNIEMIKTTLQSVYQNLYDGEETAIDKTGYSIMELSKIEKYNAAFGNMIKDLEISKMVIDETSKKINDIMNNMDFDIEIAEIKRERLFKLQFLKKKYGLSLDGVIEKQKLLNKELNLLEDFDENLSKFEVRLKDIKKTVYCIANEISEERKKKSKILKERVEDIFNEIGLENALFSVNHIINTKENSPDKENYNYTSGKKTIYLGDKGIDDIEFYIRINKGEEFTPLRKTASGGEISRIMLALKAALAEADKTEILIFDEIDTGISGKIAQRVGKLLKNLSRYHQIISVTHLPQIASFADEHFVVSKKHSENETIAEIKKLNSEEREFEIANMLSGEKITTTSIASAKELIKASLN